MKKKRSLEIWCATAISLCLLVALLYLHWRREYGPPAEETLKIRETLKDIDEVRVFKHFGCLTDACETAQSKPMLVLRGNKAKDAVNAIDFYEKSPQRTVFNGGEMGDRSFVFVSKNRPILTIWCTVENEHFGDIELASRESVDLGGGSKKRMDAYFLNILRTHKPLSARKLRRAAQYEYSNCARESYESFPQNQTSPC